MKNNLPEFVQLTILQELTRSFYFLEWILGLAAFGNAGSIFFSLTCYIWINYFKNFTLARTLIIRSQIIQNRIRKAIVPIALSCIAFCLCYRHCNFYCRNFMRIFYKKKLLKTEKWFRIILIRTSINKRKF